MCQIVKPNGLILLLAPSRGPEHRYPVDCWRFDPDGFEALAKWAGVELLEVSTDWAEDPDPGSAVWATLSACSGCPESATGRLRRYLFRQTCNFFVRRSGRSHG